MFGIFKKKSEIDKLEDKYEKLIKEAYTLSTTNRRLSDDKTAESNEVLKQIEQLKKNS
jgi:hypothetical protein